MRSRRSSWRELPLPLLAAVLSAVLILIGALLWFLPYLTSQRVPVAEVPAPAALSALTPFAVAPQAQACMSPVTVTPDSDIAEFQLRPAAPSPTGGPPVELVLSAPGYRAVLAVPGGYPGGGVGLPIAPPAHAEIASACFINRGKTPVLLIGTSEGRTTSRPATTIAGRRVLGDIALTFATARQVSLLDRLGEVFDHASNLTDRLVPAWLVWMIAIAVALGVPIAIVRAFHDALREDERPASS
jgi:hypothetical protein